MSNPKPVSMEVKRLLFEVFKQMVALRKQGAIANAAAMEALQARGIREAGGADNFRAACAFFEAQAHKRLAERRQRLLDVSLLADGYLQNGMPVPDALVKMARELGQIRIPSVYPMREPVHSVALAQQHRQLQHQQQQQQLPQQGATAVVQKGSAQQTAPAKRHKSEAPVAPLVAALPPWPFAAMMKRERDHVMAQQTPLGASMAELQRNVRRKLYYLGKPGTPSAELSIYDKADSALTAAARLRQRNVAAFLQAVAQRATRMLEGRAEQRREWAAVTAELLAVAAQREVARLSRLRSENMVAYMGHLRDCKDERMRLIFEQTNTCLAQIVASLASSHRIEFGANLAQLDPSLAAQSIRAAMFAFAERVRVPASLAPTLKPYQVDGFRWLVSLQHHRVNGILADEMGLGKTLQTIALFVQLFESGVAGPHLVVAPTSVVPNWLNELRKWAPQLVVAEWSSSIAPSERAAHYKKHVRTAHVVVTTYDFVRDSRNKGSGPRPPHLKKLHWHTLVVDEGHHLANENSKLVSALRAFRTQRKLILTGTPLQNTLHELWALLNFLLPDVFRSSDDFEQWFQAPFAALPERIEVTNEMQAEVVQRLQRVLEPFLLRRVKAQVATDLPDVLERTVSCQLSPYQALMMSYVEAGVLPMPGGHEARRLANRSRTDVRRKIENHPFLGYTSDDTKFPWDLFADDFGNVDSFVRASGKFAVLDVVLFKLRSRRHKVLIFDPWVATLECLARLMVARGYPHDIITGGTKAEDRQTCIKRFIDDPNSFVLLISTNAGGEGLNLQVADTVIIFESSWNPQRDKQAVARVHRHGQERTVLQLTFVTVAHGFTTAEQSKLAVATNKRRVEAKVIGAGDFHTAQSDGLHRHDALMRMYNEDDVAEAGEKTGGMGGGFDMDDLDCMIARSDEELLAYRRMRMTMPMLLTVAELPLWIQHVTVDNGERARRSATLVDGQRKRERINYAETDDLDDFGAARGHADGDDDDDDDDDVYSGDHGAAVGAAPSLSQPSAAMVVASGARVKIRIKPLQSSQATTVSMPPPPLPDAFYHFVPPPPDNGMFEDATSVPMVAFMDDEALPDIGELDDFFA